MHAHQAHYGCHVFVLFSFLFWIEDPMGSMFFERGCTHIGMGAQRKKKIKNENKNKPQLLIDRERYKSRPIRHEEGKAVHGLSFSFSSSK